MTSHAAVLTTFCTLLGSIAFGAMPAEAHASWVNDNPAGTSQCKDVDVSDANVKLINCLSGHNRVVFAKVGSQAAVLLKPSFVTPCVGIAVSHGAAGDASVIGECRHADHGWQAVAWFIARPGSGPLWLAPLRGSDTGASTSAVAVNAGGLIGGESIDGSGNGTPVIWSANGVATALIAPVPGFITQCEVADLTDAATPQLIGNCSRGIGETGRNLAVLWSSPTLAYLVLPVPAGAIDCTVARINAHRQMLGRCRYGADTYRAVQWGAGGTGPVVMETINHHIALRSIGVDINDGGVIAGTYLADGSATDLPQTFVWNADGGNANGVAIAPPENGRSAVPLGIGNNGKIVGNYFVPSAGGVHPFVVAAGATVAVDQGVCDGSADATVSAFSGNGMAEVGSCIDVNGDSVGVSQPTP